MFKSDWTGADSRDLLFVILCVSKLNIIRSYNIYSSVFPHVFTMVFQFSPWCCHVLFHDFYHVFPWFLHDSTACFHDSTRFSMMLPCFFVFFLAHFFTFGHCVQVRPRRVPWRCQRGRFTSRRLRSGARSCLTTCCPTASRCLEHRWLLTPLLMNGTLW